MYEEYLTSKGLSKNTRKKYLLDLKLLISDDDKSIPTIEACCHKIEHLKKDHKISSINSYIRTWNAFFKWCNFDYRADFLIEQKNNSVENVLTKQDYTALVTFAHTNRRQKAYIVVQLLACTGIRVGEVKYITVEAIQQKRVLIYNKGKYRIVCIPDRLCEEITKYCDSHNIKSGAVIQGREKGSFISEKGIWIMLKRLAREAGIDENVVYPHSFRHFFAKTYLSKTGNLADLADILGHSNIETTRIYTRTSLEEKRMIMNQLFDYLKHKKIANHNHLAPKTVAIRLHSCVKYGIIP